MHVQDSLAAAGRLPSRGRIADLGSGAGIPGLVLAVALPDASHVLVESVGKKVGFIRSTAAAMGLDNVEVVQARAEEWHDGVGTCDAVCARALAALPVLCEYAAPLLVVGGRAVFWKGEVSAQEARDGRWAAGALGLREVGVAAVEPYPGSERRTLWVFEKVAETPSRYPRRAGMATKRPLSAPSS